MTETVPLVRRGRRNARYTNISNDIINHRTLSPEARIVLIYLLSKPDDWQLQIYDVRRLLGTGAKQCGRNKAYAVIKELKASAYVVAFEELQQGRFHRLTYYVFDEPLTDPEGFRAELRGQLPAVTFDSSSSKEASNPPCLQIRETVAPPHPDFRDPVNGHLTKDRKKQTTESPPPSPKRSKVQTSGAGGGKSQFSKLWAAWPTAEQPRAQELTERLFLSLSGVDQALAVVHVGQYRADQARRGDPPKLIPYLRNRGFAEFVGAPPQMSDGRFRVTPDRPEWEAWEAHLKTKVSAQIWSRQEKLGYLDCLTRWPEAQVSAGEGDVDAPTSGEPRQRPISSQEADEAQFQAATEVTQFLREAR